MEGGVIVCAGISVRKWQSSSSFYAYLQFSLGGKTVTRYVGAVLGNSAEERQRYGLKLARKKLVAEKSGWVWVKPSGGRLRRQIGD